MKKSLKKDRSNERHVANCYYHNFFWDVSSCGAGRYCFGPERCGNRFLNKNDVS